MKLNTPLAGHGSVVLISAHEELDNSACHGSEASAHGQVVHLLLAATSGDARARASLPLNVASVTSSEQTDSGTAASS